MGIPDPDLTATGTEPARWEHQPGESARAYAAFATYRDLGPLRTLRTAAARFYGFGDPRDVTAGKIGAVREWSGKHQWVARAEEWDAYLDAVSRTEQIEARRTMRVEYAEIATRLRTKVNSSTLALMQDPGNLTVEQIVKLLPVLQSIEAWAREVPVEITEHRHSIEDFEAEKERQRALLRQHSGLRVVEGGATSG